MARRRAIVLSESSSSEDENAKAEARQIPIPMQTDTVDIDDEDEEFVDAHENPSPFTPTPERTFSSARTTDTTAQTVKEFLRSLGVNPREDWLQGCLEMLGNNQPGFAAMNVAQQSELCLAEFLFADLNMAGAAVLPPNIESIHGVEIPGPFVLQVDEIVNISISLKERYKEVPSGSKRCLKLSMTDGAQRVFGMEYRPVRDLRVLLPAGIKIVLRNVHIRRGLLMLVPEVIDVLGGVVEDLEAARKRLVEEVNKPPRGKRNRRGEEPLNLVSRALAAAWPQNSSINIPGINDREPLASAAIHSLSQGNRNMHTSVASSHEYHEMHDGERMVTPNRSLNTSGLHLDETGTIQEEAGLTEQQVEHSLHQIEESETPFTYLAHLQARKELEPVVQGMIKGILTGVKEFQFKGRDTFELFVYVDDGSLISEVLIDHRVVQNVIGHSPREVTALLASNNQESVLAIKEKLKRFQEFLKNFEGQMLVEINDQSVTLKVLELTEGCQTRDAWLLLQRLNLSWERSDDNAEASSAIDISP